MVKMVEMEGRGVVKMVETVEVAGLCQLRRRIASVGRAIFRLLLLACGTLAAASSALAGTPAAPAAQGPQLPNLRLDLKTKTIEFDGVFCGDGTYPLELLICQNTVRDYESLISSPCQPSILHTALLALGLKARERDEKDPSKVLREGDPVDIRLRYVKNGKEVTVDPTDMIANVRTKRHIAATSWVFFGSFLFPDPGAQNKMLYLGDAENWLIGVLGGSPSVIDLPPDAAGRYGAFELDRNAIPPKGTQVTVIIRPAARRAPAGE